MVDSANIKLNKSQFLILSLLFSLFAMFFGFLFYDMQKDRIITEKQNDLNAIINLKVTDIVGWRNEHIRDARILSEISGLNYLMIAVLRRETENQEDSNLRHILQKLIDEYDYHSIFLIDNENIVRFSTAPGINNEPYESSKADQGPELRFSADSSRIFMDISVSVRDKSDSVLGALVLRVDPEITLFPNIQTWPVFSKSAETLLCRREGDSVLYLNELRHKKGTAMRLKLPASDLSLPAAKALSGYEGFFEGKDYRKVDVVTYLRKIPESSWYMIAKIDKSEIYAPLKEQVLLVSIIVLLTITTFSIVVKMYLKNQRMRYLDELNRTRDKLYSIISHDLKNPFVSIMGLSELLYERSLKEEFSRTSEYASIIYSSSRNAMDLLHNLTGWTKLQTGKILFNPKEIELVSLINGVAEFGKPAAIMKSISINIIAPATLPIKADKEMLGTILRNLVINAIKFSHKGSSITISARNDGAMAEIEISDSGIGMDQQTVSRLLNSDLIESLPGTSNEKGTGLGFYICKEFIAFHDGDLQILSEPGRGSRLIVKIPNSYK